MRLTGFIYEFLSLKCIDFIFKMCNNINMKKIGILGGTFNPVHIEYVMLAKSAIKELGLDSLLIMPTYLSPHKTALPASAEHRLNMLKIAFKDVKGAIVSDYEIEKKGKSYTFETVEHFADQACEKLYFITGGDMLTDFKTWKNPERILDSCTLAVFDRENFYTDYQAESEYFEKTFKKQFVKLSYVGKNASSTKIRTYAKLGLSIQGLVPDGVEEYIKQNAVYPPTEDEKFIRENLPLKRVKHTADVVVCALQRAKELGLDAEKVRLSATLHDCAKYLDYEKVEGFVLPDLVPAPVVHAFLGEYIARTRLGVWDEEVLDAIKYHTSGKADMTTLGKLIFVADLVEEGRDYEGVDKLRELYRSGDFETCFIECLKEEFIHLINKKRYIYAETINAFRYYVK